ncbi:hypothetical protein [Microbacterium allomyrinae]|jgi:hypothetical protein|uniref:Uncharacterized protein n=1 Tax=Microbacterium allomyrinae TaxID=2830666 RepID=A0A9X1S2G9_9MICO|nr:hypothetical protein [Microbacterium allomyrinae]MCC2031362.1 hypothetical protein [Microbacterium allomyrinae]
MLSLVTAAEHQYRHEARTRDREHALRASIREHHEYRATATAVAQPRTAVAVASRPPRAVWARPIGAHANPDATQVGCAIA